jgi:hypothetical protein
MEERSYYSKDLGYVDTIQLGGIIILARIGDIRAYTYRFSLQSCFYEQMFAHLMVFSIIRRRYLTGLPIAAVGSRVSRHASLKRLTRPQRFHKKQPTSSHTRTRPPSSPPLPHPPSRTTTLLAAYRSAHHHPGLAIASSSSRWYGPFLPGSGAPPNGSGCRVRWSGS